MQDEVRCGIGAGSGLETTDEPYLHLPLVWEVYTYMERGPAGGLIPLAPICPWKRCLKKTCNH